jgi:hypothetical protein
VHAEAPAEMVAVTADFVFWRVGQVTGNLARRAGSLRFCNTKTCILFGPIWTVNMRKGVDRCFYNTAHIHSWEEKTDYQ